MPKSKIRKAISLLTQAANPSKIILFGSQARGDASKDSDIDLLVIKDSLKDKSEETLRLSRILWDSKIYADVLVTTRDEFDYWKGTAGHIYCEIELEGRVLYDKEAS